MKPLIFFDFEQTDDGKITIEKEKLIEIFDKIYTSGFDDGSKSRPILMNDQIPWTGHIKRVDPTDITDSSSPFIKRTEPTNITDSRIPFTYCAEPNTSAKGQSFDIKTISHNDNLDSSSYLVNLLNKPFWNFKKKAIIIAGYPGIGKTTIFNDWSCYSDASKKLDNRAKHIPGYFLNILDSDSSLFSWVYDKDGNKTSERNPEFPDNYIAHIKENLYSQDIIFVSTHQSVRDALKKAGLEYVVIYPDISLKDEYLNCYKLRGSDEKFIAFQSKMWNGFITSIEQDDYPTKICLGRDTSSTHLTMDEIGRLLSER